MGSIWGEPGLQQPEPVVIPALRWLSPGRAQSERSPWGEQHCRVRGPASALGWREGQCWAGEPLPELHDSTSHPCPQLFDQGAAERRDRGLPKPTPRAVPPRAGRQFGDCPMEASDQGSLLLETGPRGSKDGLGHPGVPGPGVGVLSESGRPRLPPASPSPAVCPSWAQQPWVWA